MYQKMYAVLFNAMTDALRQMERCNYGLAEDILKNAQRQTEDIYLEEAPDCEEEERQTQKAAGEG